MVKYVFTLENKTSQDEYKYALDLNSNQENNPEQIFNLEIRESMRKNLQNQSSCKIDDNHLNQIIKTWIKDIKEGYRDSLITLDLPLLIASNLASLQETGNHELPFLIQPNILDIEPCGGMLPPLIFT